MVSMEGLHLLLCESVASAQLSRAQLPMKRFLVTFRHCTYPNQCNLLVWLLLMDSLSYQKRKALVSPIAWIRFSLLYILHYRGKREVL